MDSKRYEHAYSRGNVGANVAFRFSGANFIKLADITILENWESDRSDGKVNEEATEDESKYQRSE
jgi:hypothetical protein